MKKTIEIKKSTLIRCKNHVVSIGTHNISDVAIVSKSSGEFCQLKDAGKKLKSVKRKFKSNLNNDKEFCFSFMTEEQTLDLIRILNS